MIFHPRVTIIKTLNNLLYVKGELTMEQFIEKMIDLLDTEEEITIDTVLDELDEWDSLSFVSFLAMANAAYGKKIEPSDVKIAETVGDLYDLIK